MSEKFCLCEKEQNVRAANSTKQKIYRVIDANLNRAREGVRVAEEVFRLVHGNGLLARKMKRLRHEIVAASGQMPVPLARLKLAREAENDVGRRSFSKSERRKKNPEEILLANLARSQEALRVLEEFSKLINEKSSQRFKKIRFAVYSLETEILRSLFP